MGAWGETALRTLIPRSRLSVSQWAEQYRSVGLGTSPEPGLWRNERTPYLKEPMDAFSSPNVQTVVCMMSSQTGKSEIILNVLGYYADQEPAPQLVVQPTDAMLEAFSKERVTPMFRESPGLKGKVDEGMEGRTAQRKSSNTIRIKHYPGGYIAFASAGTASGLSSRPIRIALFDEVDRYTNTREGDPIKLGIQRTANFYNRKIGLVSTPTIKGMSRIESWWGESDQRHFWIPCSHCNAYQTLTWDSLKWQKDADGNHLPKTAQLVCSFCSGKMRERQRNEALLKGEWRPGNPGARHRGYHINALYSPWVKFQELAEEWLSVIKLGRDGIMEFINLKLGLPYESRRGGSSTDKILSLKDERPRGLVPSDIAGLVAGVDTQDTGFWYEIRAIGKGHVPTTWCIREGFVPATWHALPQDAADNRAYPYHPAFDALRQVLWEDEYTDASGQEHQVMLAGIDSGGHRTTEVYDFCRYHRGKIVPTRGQQRMSTGHKFTVIETYPGTSKPIPGGVRLCNINVTEYKGRISSLLDVSPADPGAFLFHSEFPHGHATHYTAEYEDDKGIWQCISGRDNHLWDCSVYALCMADILGLRHRRTDDQKDQQQARSRAKSQTANPTKIAMW